MRAVYFGDFRVYVIEHIKLIEQFEHESYSTEWFLLKYLKRLVKATEGQTSPGRVEACVRGLMRFYIDNIDEQSQLADQCIKIYDEYRKTLRLNQQKLDA